MLLPIKGIELSTANYFLSLSRNLEERDKLSERVRTLETVVAERDDELKVLHRRLQLDAKGFKQQINSGIIKQKELMLKLDKANAEILRIGEIIRTEVRWYRLSEFMSACVVVNKGAVIL